MSALSQFSIPLLFLALAALPGANAHADMNQAEALAAAAAVNRSGSDESMQNSTTSAMKAMLELNNQNRPGAMKNGYKAFGEYRTSEDLDIVRMKNRIRQIDMFTNNVSIHTKVPAWAKSKEVFATTYSRLDPKFLHQGEAAKVAEEFERKSGMRREVFLKHMAKASESKISAKDPNLTEKVLSRFASFVDEIPNEEFRGNVKKQIESVSPGSQAGLIRDGVDHVFEILAKYGVNVAPKMAALPERGTNETSRMPSSVAEASAAFTGVMETGRVARPEDPLLASKKNFVQEMASRDADFRGLGNEKFSGDPIGSVMQTALDEQAETSIFRQVSRRYRAVTPALSQVKE